MPCCGNNDTGLDAVRQQAKAYAIRKGQEVAIYKDYGEYRFVALQDIGTHKVIEIILPYE